jgi:hypothetical protein
LGKPGLKNAKKARPAPPYRRLEMNFVRKDNYWSRRYLLNKHEPKYMRDKLRKICEVADDIHKKENELISLLYEVDRERIYVWIGYHSLMGFLV